MQFIKNFLLGLGGITLLLIILFVSLFAESNDFFEENKQFVEEFSYDFAKNWDVSDVYDRLSNDLIIELSSAKGKAELQKMSVVGGIKAITDMEMGDFNTNTNETTGAISFKAEFENAKAVVTVSLIKKNDQIKVYGFHISTPEGLPSTSKKYNA